MLQAENRCLAEVVIIITTTMAVLAKQKGELSFQSSLL